MRGGASGEGTWLFAHCGEVDLKASDVGQEEGQSPPVVHLTGNQSIFHSARSRRPNPPTHRTHLYLYDFIKEDLRILVKLQLEVLKADSR